MMYQIIVRNGSVNHYSSCDNQVCAHALFNALTQVFLHIELWQGEKKIKEYNNT